MLISTQRDCFVNEGARVLSTQSHLLFVLHISIIRCFSLLLAIVKLSSTWYVINSVQLFLAHSITPTRQPIPLVCFIPHVVLFPCVPLFYGRSRDHSVSLFLVAYLHSNIGDHITTQISSDLLINRHPTSSSTHQHFNSLEGNCILPIRYEFNWSIIIIPILMILL